MERVSNTIMFLQNQGSLGFHLYFYRTIAEYASVCCWRVLDYFAHWLTNKRPDFKNADI